MNYVNLQQYEPDFRQMPIPEEIHTPEMVYEPLDRNEISRHARGLERANTVANLHKIQSDKFSTSESMSNLQHFDYPETNNDSRNNRLYQNKNGRHYVGSSFDAMKFHTPIEQYNQPRFNPQSNTVEQYNSPYLSNGFGIPPFYNPNQVSARNSNNVNNHSPNQQENEVKAEIKAEIPKLIRHHQAHSVTFDPEIDRRFQNNPDLNTASNVDTDNSVRVDPNTDKEIEHRVTETLIKLLQRMDPSLLGDVSHQHFSQILINENSSQGDDQNIEIRDKMSHSEERKDYDTPMQFQNM
jgi:hypothetical protein